MRVLKGHVDVIHERGREEFIKWKAAKKEQQHNMYRELAAQTLQTQPGKVRAAGIHANTLSMQRFLDWLDGGKADYQGAFVRNIADRANAAENEKLRNLDRRRGWMRNRLKKLGIKKGDSENLVSVSTFASSFLKLNCFYYLILSA